MSGLKYSKFLLLVYGITVFTLKGCMSNDYTEKWELTIPNELTAETLAGKYVYRNMSLDIHELLEIDRNGNYRWEQNVLSVVGVATFTHRGYWTLDSNKITLRPNIEVPSVYRKQLVLIAYQSGDELIIISSSQLDEVFANGPQQGNIYRREK